MTKSQILAIFARSGRFLKPDEVLRQLKPIPDRRSFYSYLSRLQGKDYWTVIRTLEAVGWPISLRIGDAQGWSTSERTPSDRCPSGVSGLTGGEGSNVTYVRNVAALGDQNPSVIFRVPNAPLRLP